MSTIDTLQGLSTRLLSVANPTSTENNNLISSSLGGSLTNSVSNIFNNIETQSANSVTELGTSFSEFFTQAQQNGLEIESTVTNTINTVNDSITTLQEDLLANLLGYSANINTSINDITTGATQLLAVRDSLSLDSITQSLQSNLLGALQANNIASTLTNTEVQESDLLSDAITFSFNEDGLGLEDAFDTVNLLQHIPVVSSIYQSTTGQENISAAAQFAGDFLYGGPLGLAFSVADYAIEQYTGTSISDAITDFNYSDFIFGKTNIDTDVLEYNITSTVEQLETAKTLFFDKDSNVIYSRD